MKAYSLVENVYKIGAIDWNRRLFDSLIPLPHGTSYNSYLIVGSEKTALLDAVDPAKWPVLEEQLRNVQKIDYIIAHHGEQDHSGSLPMVLAKYPTAKLVTNLKAQKILMDLLPIPAERFEIVEEGSTISLGNKTLRFHIMPWVHWPETMVSYLVEDKILFSCDLFGSHLATSQIFAHHEAQVYDSAKRYYAEIMMPFSLQIKGYVEKIKAMDVRMIAPSHGPVYDEPPFILSAYQEWTCAKPENKAIILYISMHGSVEKMVEYFSSALMNQGVAVRIYDLTVADIGEIAMDLVDTATLVIATPTVLGGVHPLVAYAGFIANILNPKFRYIALLNSYCWGGKVLEQTQGLLNRIKAEWIEPVISKGHPKPETFESLTRLAQTIAQKHKQM